MKKNKLLLLPIIVGSLSMSACNKNPGMITIPGFSAFDTEYLATKKVNFTVKKGEETPLEIDAIPSAIAKKGVTFKSEDLTVATVSETGVVKGLKAGVTVVHVSSKDEKYDLPIKVYVTEGLTSEQIDTVVGEIDSAYQEEKDEEPLNFRMIEYSVEKYAKNGVDDHGNTSMEVIDYDEEAGYFLVGGDDIMLKTSGGAYEKSSGTWVFTCLSDYEIRLLHITATAKNFCEASIGQYVGNRKQVIYDMLDSFFVSGHEILTDAYDYHVGKSAFSFLKNDLDEGEIEANGFGENSIIYKEVGSWKNQDTTSADELLHNGEIPAGTKTNDTQVVYNYFNGAMCEGVDITVNSKYNLGEDKMERVFTKNMAFYDEFEKNKTYNLKNSELKKLGFKQVDDMFDL